MRRVTLIYSRFPNARMEKEAKALADNGYAATVIGWERWGAFPPPAGVRTYRVKRFRVRVAPGSLKVACYLPLWWLFVTLHLLTGRWDAVHAIDLDSFVPALLVARLKRKPIVYDIADFYADMIEFPIWPALSRRIAARIDRTLMRSANVIILPDESRVEQVGIDPRKKPVVIVNNSPDQGILRCIVSEDPDDERFTVYYGGGVTKDRGIMELCLAVRDLHDVHLTVMGPCPPSFEAELREACENTANIVLHLRFVPYEVVITGTARADLLFGLYDPAVPNNRFASPNKLFEAMMCGKPIVVSDGSSMTDIVRKENCGVIVRYGDIRAIREAVLRLSQDAALRQKLGANGRKAYEERYSWDIGERRLLNVYRDLETRHCERHGTTTGGSAQQTSTSSGASTYLEREEAT